jgi:uncharacterized membrane-anchored protein
LFKCLFSALLARGQVTLKIYGRTRIGRSTKSLVQRLMPGDIAVISHPALDGLAAKSLRDKGIKAVINAVGSFSPRYANEGPKVLLEAGIPLIDGAGESVLQLEDGVLIHVELDSGAISEGGSIVAVGRTIGPSDIEKRGHEVSLATQRALLEFIDNTLHYAHLEKHRLISGLGHIPIRTDLSGKHVLVVIRGKNYKEDLKTIQHYVKEVQPVLIGVDGGADAILETKKRPHLIVGDMDSVSDKALKSGAELVVHAYTDGRAPGLKRIEELGLRAHVIPAAGTSEDLALMLAFEGGASLIVAVGTHTNMIDFLDKGRVGMASTLLTRMKVGSILVDARGVSQIYAARVHPAYFIEIAAGALLALLAVAVASPLTQTYLRLLCLKAKVGLGGLLP